FDMTNNKACEGQSTGFERIQAILQTLMDRSSNLEDINKSISTDVMEWKRLKDSFDDTLFIPIESSTPQEVTIGEEIFISMDEQQSLHDHNYYCENEEKELKIE
ncbi:hypothetical protein HAX54_021775, partial [Datura stramonium]|nr:hypothetical protein [Datura stramonium]